MGVAIHYTLYAVCVFFIPSGLNGRGYPLISRRFYSKALLYIPYAADVNQVFYSVEAATHQLGDDGHGLSSEAI